MDYKSKYSAASIRVRDKMADKVRVPLQKNITDDTRRFVKLTKEVPNWKTYLTDKQLEVVDLYLKLLSSTEVDYQMRLTEGTTYHRLFGSKSRGNLAAYGVLKRVHRALEKEKKEKEKKKKSSAK
ncbi:hypothetical protein D3C81_649850 [compost metagenome]